MKVVIFADSLGTRLAEETGRRPRPMLQISGRPLLHHLMQDLPLAGFDEFMIVLRYKQEAIKDYFRLLYATANHLIVDFRNGTIEYRERIKSHWKVHLVDTGLLTMMSECIKFLAHRKRQAS